MKNTIILLACLLIALLLVVGAMLLLKKPAPQAGTPSAQFPSAGTNSSGGFAIGTQGGTTLATKDFIHNGVTIEDPANKGDYYLAGTSGACNPDGTCPTGAKSDEYNVVYYSDQQAFAIALLKEPLGQARRDAEQFMMRTLGLTEEEMCKLNYYLGTDANTNEQYAGKNLGFSFCPGAVPLP